MTYVPLLAFSGVGLTVFVVAWVTLAILVAALLAAAAYSFFRNSVEFESEIREVTMGLDPQMRRRFYELYESRHPKNPAIAWFLAVGLGPAGANLYRGKWGAFLAAVFSLNGLGAWWMESWFTTPHLVLIDNREHVAWTFFALERESATLPAATVISTNGAPIVDVPSRPVPTLVTA